MRFTLKLWSSETIGFRTIFWFTAVRYPRPSFEERQLGDYRCLTFALRVRRRYCNDNVPSGMVLPFIVWATRENQEPAVWPLWNPRPEPKEA